MWWESVAGSMRVQSRTRTAGDRVPAFAETLQDFVAAPIAQGLRDQKNFSVSVLPAGSDIPTPSSMTASN
jgi:hypothetical protein